MKGIIMAGGEGTRLRPLTCNVPKPMMPILDKPVMEYAVELLKKNGITDIGVTLQYLPDEVVNYFGDGKDFGINMRYFIEESPLGTAGSVKNAEEFLNDTFIVISGDALTDIDLSKAIAYHKKKKSIATLVLKEVAVPLDYGIVVTDKEGRVTGFLEKPSWGEVFSDKANTGIYLFEPEIFTYFQKDEKFDFSNDLFPILLDRKKSIYGYVAEGYWCDIGNIEQYLRCHFDILKGLVKINIKGEKYREDIWIGENCEISPRAIIKGPAYVGNNCKIYSDAVIDSYVVLGKSNIVSNGVTIKRSILLENCYIGSNAQVRGAVICKKVALESKVFVFENSIIGDETLVGERTIIKPGVKIWPNKEIESSTVVKTSIIWGGKLSRSIFGKRGISGEVNVDITPEFVSKIGSAYGSLLKPDSKVAISCNDFGAAQMYKYSLATGLLCMGIEVYDLKRTVTPMTRQAAMFFGVKGAIHVVIDRDNPQKVSILFMDNNGLDIDKNLERKIENNFIREDFRRVKADGFKKITHLSDCIDFYSRQLINNLGVQNIRNQKFKVVLCIRNPILFSVVQEILSETRVNIKLYDDHEDLEGLSKEVVLSNANIGIFISDEGESAVIIDEKGNIIKDDLYEALNSLVMLKSTKLKTLAAPVTASSSIEKVAILCGAKFVRTKVSQKHILEAYLKNEKGLSRREVVNSYVTTLDAVSMFMFTLDFMSASKLSLSSIAAQIPRYYGVFQEVRCPWNMKGKVMRSLIEENNSNSVDLIEGVKLNYDEGWVLVLPDEDEQLCNVYVEAKDIELADKLGEELVNKIEAITSNEKDLNK